MPVVTVEWLQGRSVQQKQALATTLTQAFVDIAKVSPDQVWIVFRDVPRADWAMGGKLLEPTAS
jgi:4-oxalocrotonate tautomerase